MIDFKNCFTDTLLSILGLYISAADILWVYIHLNFPDVHVLSIKCVYTAV